MQPVNWSKLRRSLDRVTCIRREHPQCSFHYTEAQAFAWLSENIAYTKKTIAILLEWQAAALTGGIQCEKHWINDCYVCSKREHIDRLLKQARKRLASLKFQLVSLPTVASALGRVTRADAQFALQIEAESVGVAKIEPPIAKLFGRERTGQETERQRRSDLDDNIRLVEAWLRGRAS